MEPDVFRASGSFTFNPGAKMDNKKFLEIIGYLIAAILFYYVLQMMLPFLVIGVVGLVILQLFKNYKRK